MNPPTCESAGFTSISTDIRSYSYRYQDMAMVGGVGLRREDLALACILFLLIFHVVKGNKYVKKVSLEN